MLGFLLPFLVGFLGALPGTFFGVMWWMERTTHPTTARQREVFREIRHGLDEARRDLEEGQRAGHSEARAVYLALGVLRAAPEKHVLLSFKNAHRIFSELHRIHTISTQIPSLFPIRGVASLLLFNANTLMLTFELTMHEVHPDPRGSDQ